MAAGVQEAPWREPRASGRMAPARHPLAGYAVAVLAVGVAVVLRLVLFGRDGPFVFLFFATTLAAWYGGRGPAVLAVALSTLASFWMVAPARGAIQPLAVAMMYFVEVSAVAALTVALQRAKASADLLAARGERAEAQLRKENRAHRALSVSNEILVRVRDEAEMLQAVCDAVVDVAGYRMCWVGWAVDDAARSVHAVAYAGLGLDYLERVHVTWADSPRGRGPVGSAIRAGTVAVFQDVARDPAFAPWREDALRCGYASVIGIPVRVDDRAIGALAIYAAERHAFDAEEVHLLEQLANDLAFGIASLRARALAEQAFRARDEFLRVVSHELRTPLTPLLGWAQALEADPRDPARVARGLGVIARCARAEAHLVDEMLDVTQVVAGERSVEMRPIELGPIVAACVDRVRGEAACKGIRLDVTVVASDGAMRGDRAALEKAVGHVLSNALKFTPRGGSVGVELSHEGDRQVLRVRDTGKGISAQELPHVFDMFRSGDRSMTRREGGLGSGLFVAKAIVEAHGGSVRVESEGVGLGATVVVTLPVRS